MKACIYHRYGPPEVLKVEEVPTPIAKSDEVRIKVAYVSVTAGDRRIRASDFPGGMTVMGRLAFGITKPRNKILGSCVSGVIDQVGEGVTEFKTGDRVVAVTGIKMGGCAEYVTIKSKKAVVKIPDSVELPDAAAVLFGGTASLFYIKEKGKLEKGQKVLINGASGAVGTNAVQISKILGGDVTAVTSTNNIDLVKSLGTDEVVDYKNQDVYDLKDKFDLIFDAVGNLDTKKAKTLLMPTGKMLLLVPILKQLVNPDKQVIGSPAPDRKEHVIELIKLLEEKKLKAIVSQVFSPEEIVAAHELSDTGHKVGNILIKFEAQ